MPTLLLATLILIALLALFMFGLHMIFRSTQGKVAFASSWRSGTKAPQPKIQCIDPEDKPYFAPDSFSKLKSSVPNQPNPQRIATAQEGLVAFAEKWRRKWHTKA